MTWTDYYGQIELSNIENVRGTAQGDHITGDGNANMIEGGAGADTLFGGEGNDTLDAGENYGVVDRLYGESGDDTFLSKSFYGHGIYDGGTGTDLIDFSQSTGDSAYRRAPEGAGVVVNLATGSASTYALGHAGFVTWTDYYGQIELSNIENVRGTAQGDHITGDGNANMIEGGAGNDTLDAGENYGAVDRLYGESGDDTFLSRSFYGHGIYDGGTGTDLIDFSQSTGDSVHRRAPEGAGVVVNLATGSASTYALGHAGFWTWPDYYGQIELSNIENVRGTAQGDHITGDGNANVLNGGAGNDTLDAGENYGVVDRLYGESGDDTFLSKSFYGHGIYDGGTGTDLIDFSQSTGDSAYRRAPEGAGVVVNRATGSASTYALGHAGFVTWTDYYGQIELSNIENVRGTAQGDHITGDGNANVLNGGAGNDTFLSKSFYGHGIYDGGTGTDLIDFSQSTGDSAYRRAPEGAGVVVNLATGSASTYALGHAGFVTWTDYYGQIELSNIENVRGTAQGDHITGDANANVIQGGAGNDVLYGGNGSDTFIFNKGDGEDTLYVSETLGSNATETLILGGLNRADVNLLKYNGSLYVQQKGSTLDHVKIVNHFGGGAGELDKLIFADGLTWDVATINANSVQAVQNPDYV